ncbi:MAG: hypothetical protein ABI779_12185 [Acidobacteriota bacterium]
MLTRPVRRERQRELGGHPLLSGRIKGSETAIIAGEPDKAHISTSYVERANLTMRMGDAPLHEANQWLQQEVRDHCHAISLHMFHYNFIRIHQTIRCTPEMAAGVTDQALDDGGSGRPDRSAGVPGYRRVGCNAN